MMMMMIVIVVADPGTCLSAAATLRIPLLGARPRFQELCGQLGLQPQAEL